MFLFLVATIAPGCTYKVFVWCWWFHDLQFMFQGLWLSVYGECWPYNPLEIDFWAYNPKANAYPLTGNCDVWAYHPKPNLNTNLNPDLNTNPNLTHPPNPYPNPNPKTYLVQFLTITVTRMLTRTGTPILILIQPVTSS